MMEHITTDTESLEEKDLSALAEPLLNWYGQCARILPFRQHPTPYGVWVSEIMLQQTRVEAVISYYNRFMATLPTIEALAQADEEVLLKLWEGLGYYNRVRNLQKGARMVMEQYQGKVPASYAELLKLSGIGEYTAGAIASIAYNIRVPAVDGNVLRVLSRILASAADISLPQVKKSFQIVAQNMMPNSHAGDFNQALMELGATVCLPNSAPRCDSCPISDKCMANLFDLTQTIPVKSPKKLRKLEQRMVLVIVSDNKVLIRQRPQKGLLAGLWELPNVEGRQTEHEIINQLNAWNIAPIDLIRIQDAKHIFTHIEWQMQGYLAKVEDQSQIDGFVWADKEELHQKYTIPTAFGSYIQYINSII